MEVKKEGGAQAVCFARQTDGMCAILDLGVGCKVSPEICKSCRFRKAQREVTNGVVYLKKVAKNPPGKPGRKKKAVWVPKPKPEPSICKSQKPYCSTCAYSEGSGTGGLVCMYITRTGERRGCDSSECKEKGRWKPYEGERLNGWKRVSEVGKKRLRATMEDVLPVISDEDYLEDIRALIGEIRNVDKQQEV